MLFRGECPQHRTASPPSWHGLDRAKLAHCRSAGKVSQLAVYISPGWRTCRTEVEAHDHVRVQRSRPAAKSEAPRDLINVRFAPLCGLRPNISRGPSSARSGREQLQQTTPDAVGTPITERPPHRTVRAAFPHTAPTLGNGGSTTRSSPAIGAPTPALRPTRV